MELNNFVSGIHPPAEDLFGPQGFVLVDARPAFKYEDNKRTDIRMGTKLIGVAPSRRFAQCAVTVAEELDFSKDELDSAMRLDFKGFVASIYFDRKKNQYMISAKATEVIFPN